MHSLIVGGTRGIGRELVKELAKEGHVLSVIGRRPPSEGDRRHPNARFWSVDVSDEVGLSRALADIVLRNGKLNYVVFLQRYRGGEDDWRGEIETSLTATKNIIDRLTDDFAQGGENAIVVTSSIAGHFVAAEQPLSYHVAKAGLNQMIRYYAFLLGPKGIRANCVSAGTVLKEESKDFYLKNGPLYDLYRELIPLGRMVTATEVAQVIAFLCSPRAASITGQNIVVDGGLSLQWQESLARKLTGQLHPNALKLMEGRSK